MRRLARRYWKKALAALLSAATAVTGPGLSGYAAFADDPQPQRQGRVYDQFTGRWVDVQVAQALQLLRSDPRLINQLDPGMRQRAIDYMQRLDKQTGSDAELVDQLRGLVGNLQNGGADPSTVLMQFFTNTANRAVDFERGRITQQVIPIGETMRRIVIRNTATGQIMQDIVVRRVEHGFQRFVVKQPDPASGQLKIEQLGYTFDDHGKDTQKVAFARGFNKMLRLVIRIFYDHNDIQDQLADPRVDAAGRVRLNAQLAEYRSKFPQDILDYKKEIDRIEAEIDGGKEDYDRRELELMATKLSSMQQRVMAFYNASQLQTLQKTLMAQFVYYFTSIAGLSYNPFDNKDGAGVDINSMKIEDVQRILDSFKRGDYQGAGWMPWSSSCASLDPNTDLRNDPNYDHMDASDRDPRRRRQLWSNALTLQSISLQAIQYMGFAADARERLFVDATRADLRPELSEQQRAAAMAEMDRWVRLAQLNVQRFQVQSMAIQMWRIKNKKLKGSIGLHWDDVGMRDRAQALIDRAEDEILPKMKELEDQSREALVFETAAAVRNSMLHAKYDAHQREGIVEYLKEVSAQVAQLKALYISKQFDIFAQDEQTLARYSTSAQVQGQMYKDFEERLKSNPTTKAALDQFDAVVGELTAMMANTGLDEAALKERLGPLGEKIERLFRLLNLNSIPGPEELKKRQDRLKVFQANLQALVSAFSSNLQIFDMVNELDIYMEEMASSASTDNSHTGSFKSVDNLTNVGGARDWAGEQGAKLWNHKAWEVLKQNEPLRLRAMNLLRSGDFAGALKLLADLDPDARDEARRKADRDKADPEAAFDILSLLTGSLKNEDANLAQASLTSAFSLMPSYIKGFTAGTIAYDTLFWSAVTLGFGGLISRLIGGVAKAVTLAADLMKIARAAQIFETLGIIGKAIQALLWVAEKFLRLGAWLLTNAARSIRTNLGLPTEAAEAGMKAVSRVTLGQMARNAIMFNIKQTAMMAVAGVMMSEWQHYKAEKSQAHSSSFKDWKDAALQGALSGASFGAKTSWLMMASPISTASLPKTGFLGWFRSLGEIAGPVDWASRKLGQWFGAAGNKWAAEGIWKVGGASAQSTRAVALFSKGGAYKVLLKTAVFGGSFLDGGMKFFGLAELTKQGVRDVHYLAHSMFGGDQADFATSGHARMFMESTHAGEAAAQISWLLLPMSPHGDAEARKEQMESLRAINTLDFMGREQMLGVMRPEKFSQGEMYVDRPLSLLHPFLAIKDIVTMGISKIREFFGYAPLERPKDKLKLDPWVQTEIVRRLSEDMRADKLSDAEILTILSATEPYMNKLIDLQEAQEQLLGKDGKVPTAKMPAEVLPTSKDFREAAVRALKGQAGTTPLETRIAEALRKAWEANPEKAPKGDLSKMSPREIIEHFFKQVETSYREKLVERRVEKLQKENPGTERGELAKRAEAEVSQELAGRSRNELVRRGLNDGALADSIGDPGALKAARELALTRWVAETFSAEMTGAHLTRGAAKAFIDDVAGEGGRGRFENALEKKANERQFYETIIMPSMREIAEAALQRRLKKNPALLNDLYIQLKGVSAAQLKDSAQVRDLMKKLSEVTAERLSDPEFLKDLRKTLADVDPAQLKDPALIHELRQTLEGATPERLQDETFVNELQARLKRVSEVTVTFSGQEIGNKKVITDLRNAVGWALIEKAKELGPGFTDRAAAVLKGKSVKSNAELITDRMAAELQQHIREAEANGRTLSEAELEQLNKNAFQKILDGIGSDPRREATKWAVELHGRSFKGDALDRYRETIVQDVIAGKYGEKGSDQRKDAIERQATIAALALKTHEVIDAKGRDIKTYKEIQMNLFADFLNTMADKRGDVKKSLKVFLMAHTGAGKSLLAMVLLMPVIRGVVKAAKLDGIDYNTHGELLRAQAQVVYSSFFHGKKPDFRIQTLSDLAAEHLTAKANGSESPLDRRFQIFDEFDALFLDPPTSLGKQQGSIKKDSPIYRVLSEYRGKIAELVEEAGFRDSNIEVRELEAVLSGGGKPELNARFNELQAGLTDALKQAVKDARAEGGRTAKDAKKFAQVVDISLRFGFSLEGFARYTLKDFFREQSVADPSRERMVNPIKGGKPILLHGGIQAYTDLDAPGRMGAEIEQGADIQLPFQNLEMTNAADVLRSTRFMIALSGTLPEALRPILEKAEVVITGHGTRTADGRYFISKDAKEALQKLAEGIASDVRAERELGVGVINTAGESEMLFELLCGRVKYENGEVVRDAKGEIVREGGLGIKPEEVVQYKVGDTFKAEKLFQSDAVRQNQNLEAMEVDKKTGKAKAKIVLLTVGASRGLDMTLDGYDRVTMYGLDPQKMALVNFTQGQGRIDFDRLAFGAKRKFVYFTDVETIKNDKVFQRVALELVRTALGGPEVDATLEAKIAEAARVTWEQRRITEPKRVPPEYREGMSDHEVVELFYNFSTREFREELIKTRLDRLVKQEAGTKNVKPEVRLELEGKLREKAARQIDAELAAMTRDELRQRGLEEPSVLLNKDDPNAALKALDSARELTIARRIRETFAAELQEVKNDPEAARKFIEKIIATGSAVEGRDAREVVREWAEADPNVAKNAVFFEMVLRQVQRQAEGNALTSSGIRDVVKTFKPGELSSLGFQTMAFGIGALAAWGMAAFTIPHLLPFAPFLKILQQPILMNPLAMLVMWITMRSSLLAIFRQKQKAYPVKQAPSGPPQNQTIQPPPPADEPSEEDSPAPTVGGIPDATVVPPTHAAPK